MSRLHDYQKAMLAAFPEVSEADLDLALDEGGPTFPYFVVDHGLGPMWHARTGHEGFRSSRRSAEALFLAQTHALQEIDAIFEAAKIKYAVFKGAANRLLLYENPAIRACHDLDLLVCPEDKVRATSALTSAGFEARPDMASISREIVISRGMVDIDLHWGLLREGRLRHNPVAEMLSRRIRHDEAWILSAEDALFVLLVHPAFAKHLAGWAMGLHRVVDIVAWLRTQSFDWDVVVERLGANGVRAAAWATLRWTELLACQYATNRLEAMLAELQPGRLRVAWLNRWLSNDLSERTAGQHWTWLAGFTMLLHDAPTDAMRALAGRYHAHRRRRSDVWEFRELLD